MKGQTGGPANLECPHGIHARFGCEKCAKIERRMMAIPTVALMAATLAQTKWLAPTIDPDAYARAAWDLYEAVCKRCAE